MSLPPFRPSDVVTPSVSEPVTDWIEDVSPSERPHRKDSPEAYVWSPWWLCPVVLATTGFLLGVVLWIASYSVFNGAVAAIVGAVFGIIVTLMAHAWGVAIVFADSPRRGLWFSMFPPYMIYYAIYRWQWMRQPAVLFLCGLVLAFGSIYGSQIVAPEIEPVNKATSRFHGGPAE